MDEQLNGRLRLSWTAAAQLIGWLVATLLAYGAINSRVAVLESRQHALDSRIERIENKIDRILERLP